MLEGGATLSLGVLCHMELLRTCATCGYQLSGRKCGACGESVAMELELDEAALAKLPAWKAAMIRKRNEDGLAKKRERGASETVTRARVAAGALGERNVASLRSAKLKVDGVQITTYAPSRKLGRFDREVDAKDEAACSPMLLSLLTELLGLRLFGKCSEVCTSWYDGVRAKEDEWAVLTVKPEGTLGTGTGK